MNIPVVYSIQDTFPSRNVVDLNGNPISDPTVRGDIESALWKGLLIVSTPGNKDLASFNIVKHSPNTGNFDQYYEFSKFMHLQMAKQQMMHFDTVASTIRKDDIGLKKFLVYSVDANAPQYSGLYLAPMKDYFLIIKVDYTDRKFGEDIENSILSSKVQE